MIFKIDLVTLFLKSCYLTTHNAEAKQVIVRTIKFINLLFCKKDNSATNKIKMADMQDYLIHNKHDIEILYAKKRGEL